MEIRSTGPAQTLGHCKGCSCFKIILYFHQSTGLVLPTKQKYQLFCKNYAANKAHAQISLMHMPFISNQALGFHYLHCAQRSVTALPPKMALFLHMTLK